MGKRGAGEREDSAWRCGFSHSAPTLSTHLSGQEVPGSNPATPTFAEEPRWPLLLLAAADLEVERGAVGLGDTGPRAARDHAALLDLLRPGFLDLADPAVSLSQQRLRGAELLP